MNTSAQRDLRIWIYTGAYVGLLWLVAWILVSGWRVPW